MDNGNPELLVIEVASTQPTADVLPGKLIAGPMNCDLWVQQFPQNTAPEAESFDELVVKSTGASGVC